MKKKHFYWIDWLRFLAALMVVVSHARAFSWVEWGNWNPKDHHLSAELFFLATRPGREWVLVFFVLSGFLVGGKVIEQTVNNTFNPLTFAIDRIVRIWLPLIPALIWTAIIQLYLGYSIKWLEMLGNLVALQGIACPTFDLNGPLWSLSFEIWFYVLGGCVAMLVAKPTKGLWPFIGITLSITTLAQLGLLSLCCWVLGAFCYFLIPRQKKIFGMGLAGLFLALCGMVSSQLQSDSRFLAKDSLWFFEWVPSGQMATLLLSIGVGLFTADICRREPHSVLSITAERLGTKLAAFSYTLYLTHYPLLHLWAHFIPNQSHQFDADSLLIFGAKVLSCLGLAWLIYLPFEAQTAAVKSWLKRRSIGFFPMHERVTAANEFPAPDNKVKNIIVEQYQGGPGAL